MRFIREIDKPTRHAPLLEDIEQRDALGDREAVVVIAVDDEHGGVPLEDVLGGGRVETVVVVAIGPDRAVVLFLMRVSKISLVDMDGWMYRNGWGVGKEHTSCCTNHNSSVLNLESPKKGPSWVTRALNLRPSGLPCIQLIINAP